MRSIHYKGDNENDDDNDDNGCEME